jgi:hypothetical protein
MSKFLLNLLLQISKALVNSKIQFLIQKLIFVTFGPTDLAAHSAFGPAGSRWPRCPSRPKPPTPAHPARASVVSLREYVFPFGSRLPSWSLLPRHFVRWAPAVNSVPHLRLPELARAAQLRPAPCLECRRAVTTPPSFSPLNSPLNPPPPS